MFSSGFRASNTVGGKFKKVFCPSVTVFGHTIWLPRSPAGAVSQKFGFIQQDFFIFRYCPDGCFWLRIEHDDIEPGGAYFVSHGSKYPPGDYTPHHMVE